MEKRNSDLQLDEPTARPVQKRKSRAREAADKVGIGKSHSLFTLVLFSILASTLIASYVLALGVFIIHKKHTDTGSDAALEAARELADITVEHPSTGTLSLCHWRDNKTLFFDSGPEKTRSIESVKRTYSKIEELARLSKVSAFKQLVDKDTLTLNQLENELRARLELAILPPIAQAVQSSKTNSLTPTNAELTSRIYRSVASLIANRYGVNNFAKFNLSIKLGYNEDLPKTSPAQIFAVSPEKFKDAARGRAPNMVLISYLEPLHNEQSSTLERKRTQACVAIRSTAETPAPAAFLLTFPQGAPHFATRIIDYLTYTKWNKSGIWIQSTDGEMPGGGRLAPPVEPLLTEMSPADALAVEIYHWLKYAGDRTDPHAVLDMFNETLAFDSSKNDSSRSNEHSFGMLDNQINSCLVNDTGSRLHALMYESKEGGAGQSAVARAFMINGSYQTLNQEKPALPENAMPLYIDPQGQCMLSGTGHFDTQLIREFFQDIYDTNVAARETLATIKPMQQAALTIIPQLEQKLAIERDELSSLIRRQKKSGDIDTRDLSGKNSVQQRIIGDRIEDLKMLVATDSDQLSQTRAEQKFVTNARYNASRAELNTFELNAQKLRYCREGVFKVPGGYLLGKELAFRPVAKALLDSDLDQDQNLNQSSPIDDATSSITDGTRSRVDPIASTRDKTGVKHANSPWLAPSLTLTGSPGEVFPDSKNKPTEKFSGQYTRDAKVDIYTPQMFVVDSRSLVAKIPRRNFIQAYTRYPFANIKLPQSELLYYCETAFKTGEKPQVGWSILARDFLANRGRVGKEDASPVVGMPILAQDSSWCGGMPAFGANSCPGIGCEFQVRTPLPLAENSFENSYLQDGESGRRMPLIPLLTPDML